MKEIRDYFNSLRRSLPSAFYYIFYILGGNCTDQAREKGKQKFQERMKKDRGIFKYDYPAIDQAAKNAYSATMTALAENEAAQDALGDFSLLTYLGYAIRENLCLGEKPMQKNFNKLVKKWANQPTEKEGRSHEQAQS